MKSQDQQFVISRAKDAFVFYVVLALLCALLKAATPLFGTASWAEVVFFGPAFAAGVLFLYSILVRWIENRIRR